MWLVLALSISTDRAHAAAPSGGAPSGGACDAKALGKALTDAGPAASGKAFAELAACDANAAKAAAPEAFKKILSGSNGNAAVTAAIEIGSYQIVRDWMMTQEPDARSSAISELGKSCDKANVPAFFVDTEKALADKFWQERWYRGLISCRDAAVQDLLRTAMEKGHSDRTQYFGIIEVYSRNLGADAIPALKKLAAENKDPEVATYIVNAFSDAAGVGAVGGSNAQAASQATAAINEVAPLLPERAVDQARTTLLALGSEADSDKLAAIRYKSVMQPTGGLLYGVFVTEVATCKKGDVKVSTHHATVADTGHTWPDQVGERAAPAVKAGFKLDLAEKCKGTGTQESVTPDAPFKDTAAYDAWVAEQQKEAAKKHAGVKIKVIAEDPLSI